MRRGVLAVLAVMVATAAHGESVEKQLQHVYASITVAFNKHDIKGYSNYLAPGYALHLAGKTATRAQVIEEMKKQMKEVGKVDWKRTVKKATPQGTDYLALVDGVLTAKITKDGKKHTTQLFVSSEDLWTKSKGKWRLKSTTVKSARATMDGKEVKPGG